jgi:hypothetical protein
LDADAVLDVIVAAERRIAAAQAVQMRALARFAELRPSGDPHNPMSEFAADEIAPALRLTRTSAALRLDIATALTRQLPAALTALERGEIDLIKARAVVDATAPLTDEQAAAVQHQVLRRAGTQTASQLRASLRRAVLRADPEGAARRHEHCRKDRRVELIALPEAMAQLIAYLPAEQAIASYHRLDALARKAHTSDDDRSADQRRADVFVDLLLGGESGQSGQSTVKVDVGVTVPMDALLGRSEQPGELAGYGPIPATVARRMATNAGAVWRRLLTDPLDGGLLDYGRTTYRPPANLNDYVRARDITCRFPYCQYPARRSDLDHTVPYPQGPTSANNLGALCRHHHRLKHETTWRVEQCHEVFTWTSPTGRKYTRTPDPLVGHPERPPPRS